MVEAVLEPVLQIDALEALRIEARFYAQKIPENAWYETPFNTDTKKRIDPRKLLTTDEARRLTDIMNQLEAHL